LLCFLAAFFISESNGNMLKVNAFSNTNLDILNGVCRVKFCPKCIPSSISYVIDDCGFRFQSALISNWFSFQDPSSHMNLGAMLHLVGKLSESETHYLKALQLRPNDQATRINIKRLHRVMTAKGMPISSSSLNATTEL
jgi:hypothetical protein